MKNDLSDTQRSRVIWITRGSCQGSAEINWFADGNEFMQSFQNRHDAHVRAGQLAGELNQRMILAELMTAIAEFIPATGHEDGDIWISPGSCQNTAEINWQQSGHLYCQSFHNRQQASARLTELALELRSSVSLTELNSQIAEQIPAFH